MICGFNECWVGECKNEKPCLKHEELKCCCCGGRATQSCYETGSGVCGQPLCNNCEHKIVEDGTNGNRFNIQDHCRKGEQQYEPWYMREKVP